MARDGHGHGEAVRFHAPHLAPRQHQRPRRPHPPYAPTPRRSALPMELPNTCRAAPSPLPTPFPTPRLSPHPTPWLTHAPVPNM